MTYNELSYKIRGCIFEVYKQLGPGLLEYVYEKALEYELHNAGLNVRSQEPINIIYKGIDLGANYRIDLLVNDAIIIELKSVESILPVHKKQLISYLKLTGKKMGILVNFNENDINKGIIRFVNGLDNDEIVI